jgi:hypothetical protein
VERVKETFGVASTTQKTTKLLAAVIGGSSLVTMGVLVAVIGGQPMGQPDIVSGPMTRGETVTEVALTTTPPGTALPIEKAAPTVKAKAYK